MKLAQEKLKQDTVKLIWKIANSRSKEVEPARLGPSMFDLCKPLDEAEEPDPIPNSSMIASFAFLFIFFQDEIATSLERYLHCPPYEIFLKAVNFLESIKPIPRDEAPKPEDMNNFIQLGPFLFAKPTESVINTALEIAESVVEPILHITLEQRAVFTEQMVRCKSINFVQKCDIKEEFVNRSIQISKLVKLATKQRPHEVIINHNAWRKAFKQAILAKLEYLNKSWNRKFKRNNRLNLTNGTNTDEAVFVDNIHQEEYDDYLQQSETGNNDEDMSSVNPSLPEDDLPSEEGLDSDGDVNSNVLAIDNNDDIDATTIEAAAQIVREKTASVKNYIDDNTKLLEKYELLQKLNEERVASLEKLNTLRQRQSASSPSSPPSTVNQHINTNRSSRSSKKKQSLQPSLKPSTFTNSEDPTPVPAKQQNLQSSGPRQKKRKQSNNRHNQHLN